MTFKTTLETIKNTVKDISNISASAYVGSDGLFDSATVLSYKTQLEGLTRAQAEASLTSAGLTKAQRNQVLSTLEATTATKALTTGQIEERIATQLNSAEDAKVITQKLVKTGLLSTESGVTNSLTIDILEQAVANGTLTASEMSSIASALGLTVANGTLGASFKILTASIWATIKATWTWMTTTPVGWITLFAGALGAIALGMKKYSDYIEETRQQLKETGEQAKFTVNQIKSDFESLSSTTDEVKNRYAELAQEVENLGKVNQSRGTLSTEDYEEFLGLSNQLAELYPQLTKGYDDNGNAILNLSGDVNTIVSSLNDLVLVQQKLANQEIINQMPDIWSGYKVELEDYNEELDKYERNVENHLQWADDIRNRSSITLYDENANNLLRQAAREAGIMSSDYGNAFYNVDRMASEAGSSFNSATWDFSKLTDEEYEKFLDKVSELGAEYEDAVQMAKGDISAANADMSNYINTWLSTEWNFSKMDSNMQNVVKSVLFSGDWIDMLPDTIDSGNWDEVSNWLQREFLYEINKVQDNPEISKALSEVFTNVELTPNEKINYIKQIQDYFGQDSAITIYLQPQLKDNKDLLNRAKTIATGYTNGQLNANRESDAEVQRVREINEYLNRLSKYEIELLVDSDKLSMAKTKADVEKLLDELKKDAEITITTKIDVTAPLSDIKDAYSSFNDIYDEIINGSSVSADAIDKLNEKFGEINGGESLERFKEILTTMPDDIEAQHEALNQLATDYLDQSSLIQNLTTDNAEYTESELKKLGVENAHEVVQSRLIQHNYSEADAKEVLVNYSNQLTDAKERERIASIDLKNATAEEIALLINEANAAGVDTTALQSYLRQKLEAAQIAITTNGDINNLIALSNALGSTCKALQQYAKVKEQISKGISPTGHWQSDDAYLRQLQYQAESEIKAALANSTKANVVYSGSSSYKSSSGSGSGGTAEKDTTKQYNWLKVAITRVQELISRLDKVIDNSFVGWIKRNVALNEKIKEVTNEINLQRQAYEYYIAKANSIGLSEDYKQKVQNGAIQIEDITDEALQDKIDQYQQWYEEAIKCSDAIQGLNINLSELAQQKFDNVKTEFESFISIIENKVSIIEERISRTEEQGYFVSKKYYEDLISYEKQSLSELQKEYNNLVNARNEAVAKGYIEEGSKAWSDMQSEILDVQKSIEESTTALIEYNNAIRDLDWEIFDYIEDRINQITQESEFLIDLLDNGKLYDDTGRFNSAGKSSVALHGVNYNTYMQQSVDYANELKKIESDLAKDKNNKDLIERREELLKLQQEAITNAEAEKDAIKSLVEEGINIHLDALSKLIEKYKESLSAARDLYDYQKNIGEQTQNISNLEKIILAYQGDDSEESKKIIQDTQNKLDEAKTELQETQWDKYISETEDLLDSLYTEYEEVLNQRLDDIDALIADMIEMVNQNGSETRDTLNDTAEKVGYEITNTLNTIFGDNGKQSTLISNFMNKFETYSTTTQAVINDIKNSIHTMMTKEATTVSTSNSSTSSNTTNSNSSSQSNSSGNSNQSSGYSPSTSPSGSGDGVVTVGEHVTYISGRYHEDSWGNGRSGSKNLNGQVYVTKIKSGSPYPYHISTGSKLGNGDLGWVNLDQLRGYKTGSRYINKDQLAWTQENGNEIIYRKSDGAMLTPLSAGDKVFTQEMSQNLWDMAKGNFVGFNGYNIPDVKPIANNTSLNIDIGQVVADNPEDFTNQLEQHLAKNRNVQKMVQEITLGQANGNSKFKVNKYL